MLAIKQTIWQVAPLRGSDRSFKSLELTIQLPKYTKKVKRSDFIEISENHVVRESTRNTEFQHSEPHYVKYESLDNQV
jgi:hypothetical protein